MYDAAGRLVFGRLFRQSSAALIEDLPFCEQVLVVGGGTGHFLCDLALSGRAGRILCLDASSRMLARAERRYASTGLDPQAVDFVHARVEELPKNLRFDLICTNYVLDLFNTAHLSQIVEQLSNSLKPRGLWYCTDFANGNSWRVRLSYRFFRMFCGIQAGRLPDFKRAFSRGGLTPILAREHRAGLARSMILRRTAPSGAPIPQVRDRAGQLRLTPSD